MARIETVRVQKGGREIVINASDLDAFKADGWAVPGEAKPKRSRRPKTAPKAEDNE